MPWLLNLVETFDANEKEVGKISKNRFNNEFTLIPISHTTQTAHIEVVVTENGDFHAAHVVEKENAITVIPTTIDSASRSGKAVYPYPLHDKLMYTAGDFDEYSNKSTERKNFEAYINLLKEWVHSPYKHNTIEAIYKYVNKGRLIQDLIEANILFIDKNNKLIEKWNKSYEKIYGERPEIFSVVSETQESAFVRFSVHSSEKIIDKPWRDHTLFQSFIDFYNEKIKESEKTDVCYVTGKLLPSTEKHANKIRNSGDKAKLISANDTSGFTFRGKFDKSEQVASVSYIASQKAHNALKWLITKQGKIIDNRVFLIWGNEKVDVPDLQDSSIFLGLNMNTDISIARTGVEYAEQFSKAIEGYKHDLSFDSNINILVLDSATTGRMGVLYYRNMNKEIYFERLKEWHTTCIWRHRYVKNETGDLIEFIGAPSTRDIAFAAYGKDADDRVVKGLMERLLPCILEGRTIPIDIINSAYYRISNPVAMDKWEWEKSLSITCALVNQKEGINVGLDKSNNDRDYLFGRLLAIADVLERNAMDDNEGRATNAIRYMNAFSNHPARTWKVIQENIQPYLIRLGNRATRFTIIMDEVTSRIKYEDFNDRPLSPKFLLGFHSQRQDLYKKRDNNEKGEI